MRGWRRLIEERSTSPHIPNIGHAKASVLIEMGELRVDLERPVEVKLIEIEKDPFIT
ncbi:MAG TPA: hypothetical protein VNQ52_12585 [Microbacteriaceae bacterium]|nr:hypothetical protein [Microbacteriaceae bacterium]